MYAQAAQQVLGIEDSKTIEWGKSRDNVTVVSAGSAGGKNMLMQGMMVNLAKRNVPFSMVSTESWDDHDHLILGAQHRYQCESYSLTSQLEKIFTHAGEQGITVLFIEQAPKLDGLSSVKFLKTLRDLKRIHNIERVVIGVTRKREAK